MFMTIIVQWNLVGVVICISSIDIKLQKIHHLPRSSAFPYHKQWILSPPIIIRFSKFVIWPSLVKLVKTNPEQGFKQFWFRMLTFILWAQERSFGVEQTGSLKKILDYLQLLSYFKISCNIFYLIWKSQGERYTATLISQGIHILSGCTILKRFVFLASNGFFT